MPMGLRRFLCKYFIVAKPAYVSDKHGLFRRTHNDAFHSGTFASGIGAVDLYMWDNYPQGFACSNPTSWPEVNSVNEDTEHQVG